MQSSLEHDQVAASDCPARPRAGASFSSNLALVPLHSRQRRFHSPQLRHSRA